MSQLWAPEQEKPPPPFSPSRFLSYSPPSNPLASTCTRGSNKPWPLRQAAIVTELLHYQLLVSTSTQTFSSPLNSLFYRPAGGAQEWEMPPACRVGQSSQHRGTWFPQGWVGSGYNSQVDKERFRYSGL